MHDFARRHGPFELGPDDVECAGLGSENGLAVQFSQHQGPDAVGIARADHAGFRERDQRVGALDLVKRLDQAVEKRRPAGGRDQVDDDFGVHGRLEDASPLNELPLEGACIGEVAVVGNRDAALGNLGEDRLDVPKLRLGAAGRVPVVADRRIARQHADHLSRTERVAHPSLRPVGKELVAVETDDPGRLLAAVLEGVQSQRGNGRRVFRPEHAKDPALFAEAVDQWSGVVKGSADHGSLPPSPLPDSIWIRRSNSLRS